ncbi:MAG TPA: hypothetical protein VH165_18325 [Kofleriaceae bacterium]|jgi:hypothetical protein|nr:hypothetical protein [Kofleriaceae bacterium]
MTGGATHRHAGDGVHAQALGGELPTKLTAAGQDQHGRPRTDRSVAA